MAKGKTNRFLKAGLRLLGSIPSVGRTVKKKTTKVTSKLKSMKKKASAKKKKGSKQKKRKKKLKKKGIFAIGKVVTKARKIKNNLSKKESIQKLKQGMKAAVVVSKGIKSNKNIKKKITTTMIKKVVPKVKKIKNNISQNKSIQKLKLGMKAAAFTTNVMKIKANSSKDQNGFIKSANSVKEIGQDWYSTASNRNKEKFNSLYGFGNWITFGTPDTVKGVYHGLKDQSAKKGDSVYDFANWIGAGIPEMVKGAVAPEDSFSKEHWLNSMGVAGLIAGGYARPGLNTTTVPTNPTTTRVGVGETSKGIPLNQVKSHVLEQIVRDDRGVYGYLPKEGTPYARYDFTDIEKVKNNRAIREEYLKQSNKIQEEIDRMMRQGAPIDEVANKVVTMRNQDKILSRSKMDPEDLAPIEKRNMDLYGNPIGPDAKWLFDSKKQEMLGKGLNHTDEEIWQSIIKSSMKKDDVLNTLLGLKQ